MLAAAGTNGDRLLGPTPGVPSPVPLQGAHAQLDMATAAGSTEQPGFEWSDAVVDPLLARSAGLAGFEVAAADAAAGGPAAAAGVVGERTARAAAVLQILVSACC